MTPNSLHRRLTRLLKKTASAASLPVPSLPGDIAGDRRAYDDLAAGRLYWAAAYRNAQLGLEALAADDMETAELCTWAATDCYIDALEACVRPSDIEDLSKKTKRRGRPRKITDR